MCVGVVTMEKVLINLSGTTIMWARNGTVVKVLYYKSEGRWLDPSWCLWNLSLT